LDHRQKNISDPRYVGFTPTEFVDKYRDEERKKNPEETHSAKVMAFRSLDEAMFFLEENDEDAVWFAYPSPMPIIRKGEIKQTSFDWKAIQSKRTCKI